MQQEISNAADDATDKYTEVIPLEEKSNEGVECYEGWSLRKGRKVDCENGEVACHRKPSTRS